MQLLDSHDRAAHPELAPRFMQLHSEGGDAPEPAEGEEAGPLLARALLADACDHRATDIHIDPCENYALVRFRIDGALANTVAMPLNASRRLINQFRILCQVDPTELCVQDGSWSGTLHEREIHVRATFVPTVSGEKLAARVLDQSLSHLHLNELGLSAEAITTIDRHIHSPAGLVLVAGPTGTGKSVTLFSLLNEIDQETHSVVTLEDPVEYRNPTFTQVEVSESLGINFCNGIGTLLRLDPDYLLIGETRDPATAKAVLRAANSGRAVLTSIHAEDAEGAIGSLRNWSLDDREIASALRLVIAQRLVRQLCPLCAASGPPEEVDQRWAQSRQIELPAEVPVAGGCEECFGLGFRGRTGLFEVWELNEDQLEAIGSGAHVRELRSLRRRTGTPTMAQTAMEKVRAGVTTVGELRRAALPG